MYAATEDKYDILFTLEKNSYDILKKYRKKSGIKKWDLLFYKLKLMNEWNMSIK